MSNEKKEDDEIKKEAYKLAMREFLEEQKNQTFQSIGKWFATFITTGIALVTLWMLAKMNGWNHA